MTFISALNLNKVDLVSTNSQSNVPTDLSGINVHLSNLDVSVSNIESGLSNYVTLDTVQTIENKNIDFLLNNCTNFPTSGGGSGSGDVTTGSYNSNNYIPYWSSNNSKNLSNGILKPNSAFVGINDTQTLTNKTIDYNSNTINNIPQFDPSTINTSLSNNSNNITLVNNRVNSNVLELIALDLRIDTVESDITTIDGRVTANEDDIILHSNAIIDLNDRIDVVDTRLDTAESNIDDLTVLVATNITDILNNSNNINSNTTKITSLSNALVTDIFNLATLSGTVSTHTTQISNNTSNITSLSNALATDITNLTSLSNALATDITNLDILSGTVFTHTTQISNNTLNITSLSNTLVTDIINLISLSNALATDVTNLDIISGTVSTHTTQISNNTLNIISLSNALVTDISNLTSLSNALVTDINNINVSVSNIESSLSNYVTLDTVQTIENKNIDFFLNNCTNFPTSGGGSGSGDVTTGSYNSNNYIPYWSSNNSKNLNNGILKPNSAFVGISDTQTLTNKTIDANSNILLNLPVFDDSSIQTSLSNNSNNITSVNNRVNSNVLELIALDLRLDTTESDITTIDGRVTANEADIILHSNAIIDLNDHVDVIDTRLNAAESNIDDLTILVATNITDILNNSNNINSNIINITSLSNALVTDISNLAALSGIVSTHTTQISNNTSNITTNIVNIDTNTTNIATNTTNIVTNTTDISNRVIAPATNTANYIPQWAGANSKTLVDGVNLATLATLTGTETLTNKTLTSTTNTIAAKSLLSATTNIDVYSASAPSAGQVLTAINSTSAQWSTPSSGGGGGGTGNVNTGSVNSNNYIPYWSSNNSTYLNNGIDLATLDTLTGTQSLTNKTITDTTNNVNAKGLHTATTVVSISGSIAPTSNQMLVATSASNAIWKNGPNMTGTASLSVLNVANPYKFRVRPSANQNITTGTTTTVVWGTESYDTNNNFVSNAYTVPIEGYYNISMCWNQIDPQPDIQAIGQIVTSGGTVIMNCDSVMTGQTLGEFMLIGSDTVYLTAGLILTSTYYHATGITKILEQGRTWWAMYLVVPTTITSLSITSSGGSATANASILNIANPYKFKIGMSGSQTITTSTFTLVQFNTSVYDTNSNLNTTNRSYTIPITGVYHFDCFVSLDNPLADKRSLLRMRRAGADITLWDTNMTGTGTGKYLTGGSCDLSLTAADVLTIEYYHENGVSKTINIDSYWSGFLVCASTISTISVSLS